MLSKICLKRNVHRFTFAIESFYLERESARSAVWERDDVQDGTLTQTLEFDSFPVVQPS